MEEKILTSEEIISRIEQAPKEMQTMVAKAFLRPDIDNDDIQYTFNEDTIEEMNENMEECQVENVNAEPQEGVGAGEFAIRNSKPGAGNKNFITTGSGGWNTCIKGFPRDPECDALANCVGGASGRFNEIINEIRETIGCAYKKLNCNAENFIERAISAGLEIGNEPRVGAIMCWQKGATLSGSDGAGHVAIVEKINNANSVYTSESGYGSKAFWNQTRTNSNGRWGMNSNYKFRGFIYLPEDVQKAVDEIVNPQPVEPTPSPVTPEPQPTPTDKIVEGDTVIVNGVGTEGSYGEGAKTGNFVDKQMKVIYVEDDGRSHPYACNKNNDTNGVTAWFTKDSVRKA